MSDSMKTADSAAFAARRAAMQGGAGAANRQGGAGRAPRAAMGSRGTLWTIDAAGKLVGHRVTTGLTDGQRTQVEGKDVTAGSSIVLGTATPGAATTAAAANPLAPQPQTRGRGGPPGAF
jgi:hypothetical protein